MCASILIIGIVLLGLAFILMPVFEWIGKILSKLD